MMHSFVVSAVSAHMGEVRVITQVARRAPLSVRGDLTGGAERMGGFGCSDSTSVLVSQGFVLYEPLLSSLGEILSWEIRRSRSSVGPRNTKPDGTRLILR